MKLLSGTSANPPGRLTIHFELVDEVV